MVKLILTIIIITLMANIVYAQQNQLGVSLATGQTKIEALGDDNNLKIGNPFNNKDNYYTQVGLKYYYTPKTTILRLSTGVNFMYKRYFGEEFNQLSVPIRVEFLLGKNKVTIIPSFGVYANILLSYQMPYPENSPINNKTGYGGLISLGISYQLSEKWSLNMTYENNFDRDPLYELIKVKGGGISISRYQMVSYVSFLSLGIIYNI